MRLSDIQNPLPQTQYFYASLPYFGPQSEKLKAELSKLLNKYFPQHNFRIILVNKFTIGSFFRFKDKLPVNMLSSVIYEFSCAQCASDYIGMTTRAGRKNTFFDFDIVIAIKVGSVTRKQAVQNLIVEK